MSNRMLGLSSLLIAAAIPMFIVVFGLAGAAGLPPTAQTDPRAVAGFFAGHPGFIGALYANSIVLHLAVITLAVGLFLRLAPASPVVAAIGTVGGIAWAVLDIAQSSIGYTAILAAPSADPVTVDAISKGIQNAAHLFGGIWVLSIAWAGSALFGRTHRALGYAVGAVFALHTLVVPILPAWWMLEYVGLPLFFGWTGIAVVRSGRAVEPAHAPEFGPA